MATATVTRFHAPKSSLFPTHMKRQKTILYPDVPPRGTAAVAIAKVRHLSWSALGNQIATSSNKSIKIWDPEKPRAPIHEFVFRGEQAEKVLFHPLGEPEVVSVGEDGMIRFFDVRSKASVGEIKAGGQCFTLAWSPDGSELVVGKKVDRKVFHMLNPKELQSTTEAETASDEQNDDIVRIDRATRTILSTTRMKDQTNQTCFNHTGNTLLTTTTEGAFVLLDYPSLEELARFPAHNSSCNAIAYHPSGTYIATGANDGLISLYRTDGWLPARTFDTLTCGGGVKTVGFSCDGTYVAGGSDEGQGFEIGNVETGESVFKVEGKIAAPVVAWSPRDYAVAYVSADWGFRVIGAPTPS